MPVYEDKSKKKNRFWFEFDIGKDPLTGKRKRIRKKGFANEILAKVAEAKAVAEYYEGQYIEPSKMKFSDYQLNKWIILKKISKETRTVYIGYIKNHIVNSLLGNTPLSDINVNLVQQYIHELEKKILKNGKIIAPNTVKKIYNIINSSLNDAVTMKLLKENPANSIINKPKNVETEKTVWNEEQIRKFVHESEGRSRYSLVFRFTLMTGMRQGEVLGLKWSNVDFNNNLIRITHTLTHDGKEIKKGAKNKKSERTIKIDEKTTKELIKHYNRIQEEKRNCKEKGIRYVDNDLVFCTKFGTPCSPRNLMRTFYELMKSIDVPKITFHEIRHTQGTLLLTKNVHPKIVSERLGHSTTRITLDTYSHLLPQMQDVAVDAIKDII